LPNLAACTGFSRSEADRAAGPRAFFNARAVSAGRAWRRFRSRGAVLDILSAPRDWYVEQFGRGQHTEMDVAWRRTPFEKRPFLRWGNGHLLLLFPRALLSWLGEGFHDRVFACAERRGEKTKQRYSRYHGQLVEAYALELAESMNPPLGGTRRVYGEQRYRKGGGKKISDISIDYPRAASTWMARATPRALKTCCSRRLLRQ
jgi:hypothetical protein